MKHDMTPVFLKTKTSGDFKSSSGDDVLIK